MGSSNRTESVSGAPPAGVVVLGDSIMRALSHSLAREFDRYDGFKVVSFTYLGSGLARLDTFDWLGKIDAMMQAHKPTIVIMMIGTNDKQAIQVQSSVMQPDTPEWKQEYARRVGSAMDRMIKGGAKTVYWIEIPDMPKQELQEAGFMFNGMIRAQAAVRPTVTVVASSSILSKTPGVYTSYLVDHTGKVLQVRNQDRVHLSREGADLLARHIVGLALKTWPHPLKSASVTPSP